MTSTDRIYWFSFEQEWGFCTNCSKEEKVHKMCYVETEKSPTEFCCPTCLDSLRVQIRRTRNQIHWTHVHSVYDWGQI